MNYKVKVRQIREWTYLIGAKNGTEANAKAMGKVAEEPEAHDSWFEDPVAYSVPDEPALSIPITPHFDCDCMACRPWTT